jgi:hypothetical protein
LIHIVAIRHGWVHERLASLVTIRPQIQIFVDNSNIFFGAWNSRDPTSQDRTVRIDVGRLVNEVERGRDVGVRKVQ